MTDTVKTQAIVNLDAIPVVPNTTGEGAPGYAKTVEGVCAVTAAGIAVALSAGVSLGSSYRLVRLPTNAKIKKVEVFTNEAIDTHSSPDVVLDLNMEFSDATFDGTSAGNQSQIPIWSATPTGVVTSPLTYGTPNKLFGSVTPTSDSVAMAPTDVTFNGGISSAYDMTLDMLVPLWKIFGYSDDPGGFFDLVARVSTAAGTGHAGNLGARVTYVD